MSLAFLALKPSLGVVGVSAKDGSLLWETTDWKISIANIPSPVILDDGNGRAAELDDPVELDEDRLQQGPELQGGGELAAQLQQARTEKKPATK